VLLEERDLLKELGMEVGDCEVFIPCAHTREFAAVTGQIVSEAIPDSLFNYYSAWGDSYIWYVAMLMLAG
jgi:hypothetical protein